MQFVSDYTPSNQCIQHPQLSSWKGLRVKHQLSRQLYFLTIAEFAIIGTF